MVVQLITSDLSSRVCVCNINAYHDVLLCTGKNSALIDLLLFLRYKVHAQMWWLHTLSHGLDTVSTMEGLGAAECIVILLPAHLNSYNCDQDSLFKSVQMYQEHQYLCPQATVLHS